MELGTAKQIQNSRIKKVCHSLCILIIAKVSVNFLQVLEAASILRRQIRNQHISEDIFAMNFCKYYFSLKF